MTVIMRLLQGEQLYFLTKLSYKLNDAMFESLSDIELKYNEGKNTIAISPKIAEHLKMRSDGSHRHQLAS